jgi:hypothetical protein
LEESVLVGMAAGSVVRVLAGLEVGLDHEAIFQFRSPHPT